jgi:hypothetical protein
MMRLLALSIVATALTACSGSGRIANVAPGWANTSQRLEPLLAQNEARQSQQTHREAQAKPDAVAQETKPSEVRSLAEE